MRAFWLAGLMFAALAAGDDSGVPPRPKPTDYPEHETAKTAVLGAVIVPSEQVRKMLTPDIRATWWWKSRFIPKTAIRSTWTFWTFR